jgi:hypothetical protein
VIRVVILLAYGSMHDAARACQATAAREAAMASVEDLERRVELLEEQVGPSSGKLDAIRGQEGAATWDEPIRHPAHRGYPLEWHGVGYPGNSKPAS